MKTRFTQMVARFDALSLREQALFTATLVALLFALVQFGWVAPRHAESKVLAEAMTRQAADLARLETALKEQAARVPLLPTGPQQAQRDELRQSLEAAQALAGRSASNGGMASVIRSLVAPQPGLALMSLKTLPATVFLQGNSATPVAARAGNAAPEPLRTLWRHGVEVTIKGQYVSLLPYLKHVERNAPGVFWEEARLDVVQYPEATLKFRLHVLSTQPEALTE
jgi:MSHA biogenesis protein MshJ